MNTSIDEASLTPGDESDASGEATLAAPAAHNDGGERAGWLYLLALSVVGLLVLGVGLVSREAREPVVIGGGDDTEQVASGQAAVLDVTIENGTVALSGELPDDGAVAQAVALATARFGEGNVTSTLTSNSAVTLAGGAVNVSGVAEEGDEAPNGLQSDLAAAFGIEAGSFEIDRTEAILTPVRADAVVAAGVIELSGAVDAGDTRATEFQNTVLAFFSATNADTTGLEIDTSPEALARLEERLRAEVAQEPILFASGEATINAESAPILERLALAINATPGVDVEVVGHTDGQGGVETNQEISERRAQAVVDRLVALGVDVERLRARGAGESEPIGDNDTEEGRAQNRRIAFEFDGAS